LLKHVAHHLPLDVIASECLWGPHSIPEGGSGGFPTPPYSLEVHFEAPSNAVTEQEEQQVQGVLQKAFEALPYEVSALTGEDGSGLRFKFQEKTP